MQAQLTLLDRKGERHNLRQKEFDEASETLGVHIAMNGDQTGLIEALKEKADLFAEQVCTIPSDFNTVQYVYEVSLMPQLGYCFAAQSIPKSSWKYIMKKAKKAVLQRSGMAALFPHKVLYGPVRYGGFGFKNPYT